MEKGPAMTTPEPEIAEPLTGYGPLGTCADFVASLKTTSEVARICGCSSRDLRRWVHRGDIPDGPRGVSGQGKGNELAWSPKAIEQALIRSKERRGHDHNRPGMRRGRGEKLPKGVKSW